MSTSERVTPPMDADERTSLASWLDFYRATLADKCAGLDEEQLRTASAPPSPLTLVGLVRHLAEVERHWFRRVLAGEDVPDLFPGDAGADGMSGGFGGAGKASYEDAVARWRAEVEHARALCATRSPDDTGTLGEARPTLRWIQTHLIAEYARHCGHADLIRERIDGRTGV
ncbi:DinB family protein [Streptomyces catenulae]|uniref:DinB family protein n=1 Tax=Streptomyces catenulae TaxID=66875 RepID=A0ABV2Z105_9ACTN|nr:DinB family protein [Streptomyces catenulae]